MATTIGINQRIPIYMIEMAMKAALDGTYNREFALELAAGEYTGENRIKKCLPILGRLSVNNPLLPFLKEHRAEIQQAIEYKGDRALIFAAIICAAYPFAYDMMAIMGKYFEIQDQITSKLITERMSTKYGSNRSLPNALYCILPMMIDAGILSRPRDGVYERIQLEINTQISRELYNQSFIVHNPMFADGFDFSDYPYIMFEY